MAYKVVTILGTRPEALKLAPIISHFNKDQSIESLVINTGQHDEMLNQVLDLFGIPIDYDLDVMKKGQPLPDLTTRIVKNVSTVLQKVRPDIVLVQGDTTTTFGAALSAYYEKIPVIYIESGLRTQDLYAPFPEEANRRMITSLAHLNFAPSLGAEHNLLKEGVPRHKVLLSGNTIIDTLKNALSRIKELSILGLLEKKFSYLSPYKKLILVTGHRRENLGKNLDEICKGILRLSKLKDVEILFPVHLNPLVQNAVKRRLSTQKNIHLIEPLGYLDFVYLMKRAYFLITDSGGVQEEASYLRKPILVTRHITEREEALSHPTESIVGADQDLIFQKGAKLLNDALYYRVLAQSQNPYGEGGASDLIVTEVRNVLKGTIAVQEQTMAHKKA